MYSADDGSELRVVARDTVDGHISAPLLAFQRLLLSITYHSDTIAKYVDVEGAQGHESGI
jgi:hypothetical protein